MSLQQQKRSLKYLSFVFFLNIFATKRQTPGVCIFPLLFVIWSQNSKIRETGSGGLRARVGARAPARSAPGSVISEILGKFQAGEGGGIFHAGAAVPARLTPPRLRSAAGGAQAPGCCRPASRRLQTVGDVPEVRGTVPS